MMSNSFQELTANELENIDGGSISLTVLGVTLTGWKAVVAIGTTVTALGGVAAGGFYLGYK